MRDTRSLGRAAVVGVTFLAVAFVAYGLMLLLVGQEWTLVEAVPLGDAPAEATTMFVPAPHGLIPVAGGLLILGGLAVRRPWLAWIGTIIVAAFAVAFVFGVGGVLVPLVAVLVIVLALAAPSIGGQESPQA